MDINADVTKGQVASLLQKIKIFDSDDGGHAAESQH